MTWSDVMDLRWKDLKKMSRKIDRDDVLHRMGLEQHTPTSDFFASLGVFAVGVAVGAALGLMFAPKPGTEMRSQLNDRIRNRGKGSQDELTRAGGIGATDTGIVGNPRSGGPGSLGAI
jgi:hypothetical protein